MAGAIIVIVLAILALIGPILVPTREQSFSLSDRLKAPSADHLLGTDDMGRDILSRVILGAGISMRVGITVVVASVLIGVIVGAISGYYGGWLDEVLMRIVDIFLAVPSLVLAMAIAGALEPSIENAMLAISLVWWPWYARIVRAQTLSIKREEFVAAAQSLGVPVPVIIWRHIIPNCVAPVIVQASLDFGYTVLTAASLGFLGLGAQPPKPEWGLMISQGRSYFPTSWWVATVPGLAIFLTVMGFNLLGDGLRDVLDPKLKE